jgi:hypothetical protein
MSNTHNNINIPDKSHRSQVQKKNSVKNNDVSDRPTSSILKKSSDKSRQLSRSASSMFIRSKPPNEFTGHRNRKMMSMSQEEADGLMISQEIVSDKK